MAEITSETEQTQEAAGNQTEVTETRTGTMEAAANIGTGTAAESKAAEAETAKPANVGKTYTEAELKSKLENERGSWEKQAGMSPDELAAETAKQRESELAEREAAIIKKELRIEARAALAKKGLPASLAEIADCSNEESLASSLAAIEAAFSSAVSLAVNKRLAGAGVPKAGISGGADGFLSGLNRS